MEAEGAESLAADFVSAPHVGAPDVDVAMAPGDSDVAFASTRLGPEVASAPARPTSMRYRVQFTTDQTYVDLLEQARDLLEHQIPDRDLPTVQRLAIEALVEKLNRRKYGAFDTAERQAPKRADSERFDNERSDNECSDMAETSASLETASPETASLETASPEMASLEMAPSELAPATASAVGSASRSHSRHLPAALRRCVAKRDGGRCTYVDSRGVRCRETARLEFHHEHAHARGGPTCADNITLRCSAHNDLAAEKDFGRHFIERKKRGEPAVTRCSAPAPARNSDGDGSDR